MSAVPRSRLSREEMTYVVLEVCLEAHDVGLEELPKDDMALARV